jgi:PAS domain S-box-containing protein
MRQKPRILLLFILLLVSGTFSVAQESKLDSLQKMLTRSDNDTSKVNTLIAICWEQRITSPETAVRYSEQAATLARNLNFTTGEAKAQNNIGVVYHLKGELDKAITFYKKAAALYEKAGKKKGVASVLGNIASVYQAKGKYALALDYFTQCINAAKEAGDRQRMAIALGSIGIIFYDQGYYAKSLACYLQSLKIRESLGDKQGMAYALSNIGLIYDAQRNYPKALEYYGQALKIRKELDDEQGIATSLINIGMVYYVQSRQDDALNCFMQALAVSEKCGFRKGVAAALNNSGDIYRGKKQYAKAAENYKKALKINRELNDRQGVGSAYHSLGLVNKQMHDLPTAFIFFKQSLDIAKETGNKEMMSDNFFEIAGLDAETGNYKEAYDNARLYAETKDSLYSEESLVKMADMQAKYETDKKEQEIRDLSRKKELQDLKIDRNTILWYMSGALFLLLLGLSIALFSNYRHRQKTQQLIRERESELALQASEKKYKDLANLLPQIVLEMDRTGKLVFINHAGLTQTGYAPQDITKGLYISSLFAGHEQKNLTSHIEQLLKGEHLPGREFTAIRKDQGLFPALCYFSVADSKEEMSVLRGIIIDVSEMKQVEIQILNRVVEAEERERRRFAKDLHDGLGPLLSSIKIYVNELQDNETSAEEKSEMLRYINELIDDAVNDTRTIANNLMPSNISDYGLIRALQTFCDKMNLSKTISIAFSAETIHERFIPTVEITMYRIVLELINNTIRHAEAKNIEISFVETDKELSMNYRDDGKGFNFHQKLSDKESGLGIRNILDRVKSLDGYCEFRSRQGKETLVRVEIYRDKLEYVEGPGNR